MNKKNYIVYGIDSLNNYYDLKLKKKRLTILTQYSNFIFFRSNIQNKNKIKEFLNGINLNFIFHLAAQAGIRLSLLNPEKYFDNNIQAFLIS